MRISDWSSDVCSSDLIVPGDRLPVLWRDDYVQNSNDSAWLSNPEAPLTGYPAIVSEEGVVQGGRTRMGIAQIEARLAGTDGRPGTTFDAATRSEEHTSELQSLMRISYAVFCLKKQKNT